MQKWKERVVKAVKEEKKEPQQGQSKETNNNAAICNDLPFIYMHHAAHHFQGPQARLSIW